MLETLSCILISQENCLLSDIRCFGLVRLGPSRHLYRNDTLQAHTQDKTLVYYHVCWYCCFKAYKLNEWVSYCHLYLQKPFQETSACNKGFRKTWYDIGVSFLKSRTILSDDILQCQENDCIWQNYYLKRIGYSFGKYILS